MKRPDVIQIEERLVMLKENLTEFKKLKKTDEVRKEIKDLIARIQRNQRWIQELEA